MWRRCWNWPPALPNVSLSSRATKSSTLRSLLASLSQATAQTQHHLVNRVGIRFARPNLLIGGECAALPALGNRVVPRLVLLVRQITAGVGTTLSSLDLLLLLLALLSG